MGCETNGGGVENLVAGLVQVYDCHLLSNNSDFKGGEELMEAALVPLHDAKSRTEKHSLNS